jgi:hypothetical protein
MKDKLTKQVVIILILFISLISCNKQVNYQNQVQETDCSQNNFAATVGITSFSAKELIINTNYGGPNSPPTTFTRIFASSQPTTFMAPPRSSFSIFLLNSTPGTYYLGKLGVKRDSINFFTGEVSYDSTLTVSTGVGYETDSIHNGILTITEKDEQNRQLYGTFNFNAKKFFPNDTITIFINGSFQGCY